jgi:hypothetical protein
MRRENMSKAFLTIAMMFVIFGYIQAEAGEPILAIYMAMISACFVGLNWAYRLCGFK